MKNSINVVAVSLILLLLAGSCQKQQEWTSLFNGQNLDNWEMYLGTSLGADFDSLAQIATTDQVFSITQLDGDTVILISGVVNGSLATKESFENYHLRLEYKWGETLYSRRNSGLLYHSFGEFGAAHGTWMPNIELQLMHQNLGDTYLMANTTCEIPVVKNEEQNQYFFSPGAEKMIFGEHATGRMVRKAIDAENPLGEWNVVDLYCFGTTAVHVVNGKTVMVNYNTGVYENGTINPLTSGRIQLQSEGAELIIKSVDIKTISEIPASILQ